MNSKVGSFETPEFLPVRHPLAQPEPELVPEPRGPAPTVN